MRKGPFDFPWGWTNDDTDHESTMVVYDNLNIEMAFVLYSIGILHAVLGNKEDRCSSESMKTACTHYQSAAWAFHSLPDLYRNLDQTTLMNSDYLAIISQISLAQAQECILEKSILDHRKANIIVKVGAQVVDFYKQAFKKSETSYESIRKTFSTDLAKYLCKMTKFKMHFYNAVTQFFMGDVSEEESKW